MNTEETLNKLAKWRTVFAGWQLGTRPKGDPECDAVRDHRELGIMLRVECRALVQVLIDKGIFTEAEWDLALKEEALKLDAEYEKFFPGFKSTQYGMEIDPVVAAETTKGWKP